MTSHTGAMTRLLRLRWPRWVAVAFCGTMGTLVPAAYGTLMGVREPAYHDEFSYLLGADTFARGRLTNPAPSLPEFFEAPHVLVVPTYNSKYPPAQPLILALGQTVTARLIWGVWFSCGLFAACLCWMLQAWTTRHWALAVTILMVATLGMSTYWAQSYWGGMVAASGGALVFGGMRRTLRAPAIIPGVLMAVGALLLANTRPYEGLLASAGCALVLGRWVLRDARSLLSARLTLTLFPAGTVLLVGLISMAHYNHAVTGDSRTAPYVLHMEQYFHHGMFLWSPPRVPLRQPPERVAKFYRHYESAPARDISFIALTAKNLILRLIASLGIPFGLALGQSSARYYGILLWSALLMRFWRSDSTIPFAVWTIAAVLTECIVSQYVPVQAPIITLLVVTPWLVAFDRTHRRNQWSRFITAILGLVVVGQSVVWWWWPHYSAPITPLLLAAVATSIQRIARRTAGFSSSRHLGPMLVILLTIHFATVGVLYSFRRNAEVRIPDGRLLSRADVTHRLEQYGGSHLVFVQYDANFTVDYEWVYNPADLESAQVVFAHDLGNSRNPELAAALRQRSVWLAKVSRRAILLEPYSPEPPER